MTTTSKFVGGKLEFFDTVTFERLLPVAPVVFYQDFLGAGYQAIPAAGSANAGGELLTFDRARLFWLFRLSFDATISDADGFVPRGDELTVVTETFQLDDPINLAPPITVEERALVNPAVWDEFAWDAGSDWV